MVGAIRVLVLGVSAAACALAAGLVSLWVHLRVLPPSDGAYGQSVREALRDPFVGTVWTYVVCLGAIVGFAFSLWTLRGVKLIRAVPTITAVTVTAAGLASLSGPFGAPVGLVAAVTTMFCCRRKARRDAGVGEHRPVARARL